MTEQHQLFRPTDPDTSRAAAGKARSDEKIGWIVLAVFALHKADRLTDEDLHTLGDARQEALGEPTYSGGRWRHGRKWCHEQRYIWQTDGKRKTKCNCATREFGITAKGLTAARERTAT